jgi:formylglycine-generating enzyme required for sulfatase activity
MHGNVSEWCQDRLGENPKGDVVDPPGIDRGSYRVVRRGGTWDDSPMDLHSADWYWGTAGNRDNFSGCRVALNLD